MKMFLVEKMKLFASLLLFVLTATSARAEVSPSAKPVSFYVNYELTLASDGAIEKLDLAKKNLSPLITEFLEKSIRSWKFTPGGIDGVPQRTESSLWLNVEASPREDGSFELKIVEANAGAFGAISMVAPVYPLEPLRQGQEAVLRLLISYDENGVVTEVGRVAKLGPREERLMKPFQQASFLAAKQWRFRTEKVGGRGVAGTVIVPIRFCTETTLCSSFLTGSKENEKLAQQLASQVLLGSSQVAIQRTDKPN